jgi:hypothetical protein
MPISDDALQNAKNRFLAVKGEATVGQAIAALHFQGGQAWWHLVVQMEDGSWGITRFTDLYRELEGTPAAAEIRLDGWSGLVGARAVEQRSMETRAAQALAKKSSRRVLVVTDAQAPIGILFEGTSRGGASMPPAKLEELCGKYVNLKNYGSILLATSKTRTDHKPPQPANS